MGQFWFVWYVPRRVHATAVLALLGLPLLKMAPVQLASCYSPLVDMVLAGAASLTTLSIPSLEAYGLVTWSSPISTRSDYCVQPGLHPALETALGTGGT